MTPAIAEIKAAAEESLSHTWSGREIPFGSSIPSAFRDAVRAEKANARNVLWLAERVEELAEALRMIQNGPADVEMVSYSWAAGVATSALASLEDAESTIEDPTEGLPPDLVRVLRDPTITIQRDHEIRLADGRTLFEHLEEWRKAPSNTASADLPEDSA